VSTETPEQPQPTYALVELMGHVTIIGAVSDATIAGAPALRIDRLDGRPQHVWPQSLYRVTEFSEEEARALWDRQARSRVTGLPPSLAYHLTLATAALEAGDGREDVDDDYDPWHSDGGDQDDDKPAEGGVMDTAP
jgi:hypothetical protein